ncbi:MAG: MFS transporter [Promethearchaeota archaeon]
MKNITSNSKSEINVVEKFSFAIVNLGNIPIMTILNGFLLIFYMDIVGLDPIAVATLFLISRLVDAFNDPITGFIIDHLPNTKWGRFRPYLIIGSLICSFNFILLWLGPSMATTGKLVIAYISYLLLGITFDLMDIPLNSMIPVMTTTAKERNNLSRIKGFSYLLGALLIMIMVIPIVESFKTPRDGYHFLIISAAIIVFAFSLVGTLGIKERVSQTTKEKYRLKDMYKILGSKPVIINFAGNLLFSIGSGATSAMIIFFWTYVVGIPILYSIAAVVNLFGILIGTIISSPISNKAGKKSTMVIGLIILGAFSALILLIPSTQVSLIYILLFITGIGYGLTMAVAYGISADTVDYVELEQGYRTEAAIASLSSFITKTALGIGSAMAAYILAFTGYVPNVAQTEQAILGIYLGTFLLPGLLALMACIIYQIGYPLTKEKNKEIALELSERRKMANK